MEQGNGYTSEGGDRTATRSACSRRVRPALTTSSSWLDARLHLRRALRDVRRRDLSGGIGRVVYGQSEKALKEQTGAHEENPTLDLPCATVFAAGQRPTEVVGPLLEDEAAKLQADFWNARG